ncbi:hypothetical protein EUGRSUZ_E02320 [Eucalyptus grandis]|uniref:Uncharacterized protein n=2 Tax=Eucalyptus grandis TaxID=71139 RepID=A0ACC3KWP6_EUCGR|nr:hypothetical protein EUGRSUZ_E02320 [Eucalyptus grandis]
METGDVASSERFCPKIGNLDQWDRRLHVCEALEEAKPKEDAVRWQATKKVCFTVESFNHFLKTKSTWSVRVV